MENFIANIWCVKIRGRHLFNYKIWLHNSTNKNNFIENY